jgi:hypothetical protein
MYRWPLVRSSYTFISRVRLMTLRCSVKPDGDEHSALVQRLLDLLSLTGLSHHPCLVDKARHISVKSWIQFWPLIVFNFFARSLTELISSDHFVHIFIFLLFLHILTRPSEIAPCYRLIISASKALPLYI